MKWIQTVNNFMFYLFTACKLETIRLGSGSLITIVTYQKHYPREY